MKFFVACLLGLASTLKVQVQGGDDTAGTVKKVVFKAGTGAAPGGGETYSGTINVVPGQPYDVNFSVLQNDLGDSSEYVAWAKVNGQVLGNKCRPPGGDYDCTFHDKCYSNQVMTFNTATVPVEYRLVGNSRDCDCDMNTFQCSRENTVSGRTPMLAMARFTMKPVISEVVYKIGTGAAPGGGETYRGTINVVPGQKYNVNFAVLQNDLGDSSEYVANAKINGVTLGNRCDPPGGDYDCTFHDKCYSDKMMTFDKPVIPVEYRLVGNSKDCDCDMRTFQCFREGTTSGNSPMLAMARYKLTAVGPAPVPPPVDVTENITCGGGRWQHEISWTLDCSGKRKSSGKAETGRAITLTKGESCTLNMADSWGDGWEDNHWKGFGADCYLATGKSGTCNFTVPN